MHSAATAEDKVFQALADPSRRAIFESLTMGEAAVKNMLGNVTATLKANEAKGSVLPESVRKFYLSWGREDAARVPDMLEKGTLQPKMTFFEKVKHQATNFAFGKYTVDLSLDYGVEEKKTAGAQYSFWVFPWQLLSVVFLALILVIFGGRFLIKRRNRKLIDQAKKELEKEKEKKA